MDNIEEQLDFKWLDQVQSVADIDLSNDIIFETTVCSAEFQSWLEGSEGPFLENSMPATAADAGVPLASSGAAAVGTASTGTGDARNRSSMAGAQPTTVSSLASKQESINQTNQTPPPVYTPGTWQPFQGLLPASQHDVLQYQQPLQQQQTPAQTTQQHWAVQQQGRITQPVPLQVTVNGSIPPAGHLLGSTVATGVPYMQPQSVASGVPAATPGAPTSVCHMGTTAINCSQPAAWPGVNVPNQLLIPAAANSSAPGAGACGVAGASGWILACNQEAPHTAAVASPARGRKGSDSSRDRAGPHGRKSSADKDDADFTGPAITKSGAASRRFRARQKQMMATLEDELTGKLQQLQMLQAENETLKLKESVLAAAVESGEKQMLLLQESGPSIYDCAGCTADHTRSSSSTSAALQGHGSGHASTPPNSSNTAAADSSTQTAADIGTSSTAESAALSIGKVSSNAGFQQQQQQQGAVSADADAAEAVKSMSTEDMLASWKQYLKDLTRELMNLQTEAAAAALHARAATTGGKAAPNIAPGMPSAVTAGAGAGAAAAAAGGGGGAIGHQPGGLGSSTPAAQRLAALVDKYSGMMRLACALNPGAYCRLFGLHIDTGLPASYTDDHWRSVLAQVNLSQEQVKRVLACADLYFSHMLRLQQERVELKAKLKQSDVAKEQLLHDTGLNPGSPWLIGLSSNLKREHMLRIMLNRFIWQKILSPLQAAKTCVYSHPFYPDWHAIMCVLRDLVRGPSSDASLMAAASAAISSHGLRNSRSEADLEQQMLRWREAANASLSQHPRTHLVPGVSFPELA